jgi:hypothetical protein
MAGFLDSQQQIIDMVLTSRGKMLLSNGVLRFVYWAAFDDEVNYDPVVVESGSLNDADLAQRQVDKTEDPLIREAVQGYKLFNKNGEDFCNVHRALITVPPGHSVVPTASVVFDRDEIVMQQQPIVQNYYQQNSNGELIDPYSSTVNMGILRYNSTAVSVDAEYSKESFPSEHRLEGFYVKVLVSGTDAYTEQHHTLDENSEIVIGAELKIKTNGA